jgi:hypothetical protein
VDSLLNQCDTSEYFLGANSPYGFYSLFEDWLDYNELKSLYIFKGGPGTGKSTAMRRIADRAKSAGYGVECVCCTRDPDSLDGVFIPGLKLAFADGTAPHVIDPKYPGAIDKIVNFGDYWDEHKIKEHKARIIEINTQLKELYCKATRYLLAASSLLNDMQSAGLEGLNLEKMGKASQRLSAKLKKECSVKGDGGKKGREKKRFFSTITDKGIITRFDTAADSCQRVYLVDDDFELCAMFLNKIKSYALEDGFDIITGYCPCNPSVKLEHLIIPALSACFITSNRFHPFGWENCRRVNMKRFVDPQAVKKHRFRLRFDRKATAHMIDGVTQALSAASALHGELEQLYIPSMDFDKVEEFTDQICQNYF